MRQIDKVFTQYSFFDSRQIAAYLPRKGYHAGRHRIRRLMKIMGLEAIYKRPNTSKKCPENRIYPYLLRNMQITQPKQVWCSDISYIPPLVDYSNRLPAMNERLWRSLKQEAVYLHELTDGFVAEQVISKWITFYNTDRPHTALEKRTPDEACFDGSEMMEAA